MGTFDRAIAPRPSSSRDKPRQTAAAPKMGSRLDPLAHVVRSSAVARRDEGMRGSDGATATPLAQLAAAARAYRPPAIQRRVANRTGLPDALKANAEARSGVALDDVKVHYNSAKPSRLQAHAYAQGSDIHIGPGQAQHLGHELWHVVQQKKSQIKPTREINGVPINDDKRLESDADRMAHYLKTSSTSRSPVARATPPRQMVVQREETD